MENWHIVFVHNYNMMFLLHQFLDSKSLLGQNCSTSITKQSQPVTKANDLLRKVLIDVQTCKGAWPGPSWRLYPRRMQRNWLAQSPIRKVPITPSFRPSVNPEVVRQSKGLLGLEHLLTRGVHPYAAGSTISFAAAARTSTRELSLSPSRSKEANYSSVVSPK